MRTVRRRFLRGRADESGLTTLEWLLIVAAVAGLAALAVVLVQNVVDDTAQEISGGSARETAAEIAAQRIISDANRDHDSQPARAKTYEDWSSYYRDRCDRLEITYSDAGIETHSNFDIDNVTAGDKVDAAFVDEGAIRMENFDADNAGTTDQDPDTGKAVAQCLLH